MQIIKTEGEDLVVLTRSTYEALVAAASDTDAVDASVILDAQASIARGDDKAMPEAVWEAIEAAPHPLGPIRRWRRFTQQQLAEAADIAQPTVSSLEAGRRSGSPRVLSKLAAALRVPVGHLIA